MDAKVPGIIIVALFSSVLSAACYGPRYRVDESGIAPVHLAAGTRELVLDVGGEPKAGRVVLEALAITMGRQLEEAGYVPRAGALIWTYSHESRVSVSLDPALTDAEVEKISGMLTSAGYTRPVTRLEVREHPATR